MRQGRRLPCHQHRDGPLGSQTEPVPQKCAPSSPATSLRQGAAPMGMPVDEFGKFLHEDIAKWAKLVKSTGMKVD